MAPVDGGDGQLRLLYTSTGFKGGVVDAAIHATLSNKTTVRSRSIEAPLVRGRETD